MLVRHSAEERNKDLSWLWTSAVFAGPTLTGTERPEKEEDSKDLMPTERKSNWRSAEERRMSDLTRVLEWMERRQGKRRSVFQKYKLKDPSTSKARRKEEAKTSEKKSKTGPAVVQKGKPLQLPLSEQKEEATSSRREEDGATTWKGKGKQYFITSLYSYGKEVAQKSDAEIKETMAAADGSQRPFRRQSFVEPSLQEIFYINRRSTLLREWAGKTTENVYERKLKSLMEKGQEPKIDSVRMLKPDEVLSCRYLRLSKNNIKTLLKLCKDAGMEVDIHPHMVEAEIDAKKVFPGNPTVAL
ncbi:uncharacterized protein C16orf78 homolog isoform X2 [Erinaceus europaeus]|nr:uncharacterized protein C16orf78 homolog isoform X2 [Erinaceus europaeus]